MHKHWYVYVITNTANGKMYVGKSWNPGYRWNAHRYQARAGHSTLLHRAIRKYGSDSFSLEVVAGSRSEEDAFDVEKVFVERLRSNDPRYGYNRTAGGDGTRGLRVSEETRLKLSIAHTGRVHSAESRARMSAAQRGHKVTWGAKISASKRGVDTSTPEQREASRARMSRTVKERTPEQLARIIAALHGRPVSESTRARLRAGQERAGKVKITDADVREIRTLYARGEPGVALANRFGVTPTLISRIAKGQSRLSAGGPLTLERRTNPNIYRRPQ